MKDINIQFKDEEEPELFENMSDYEIRSRFLYLSTDIEVEYYIPLENIRWFQIDYKEEVK